MSKTGAKLAESIDIQALAPPPPQDLFQKAQEAGFSTAEYIVFRRDGKWDKKNKRRHFTGRCTACGRKTNLKYVERGVDHHRGDVAHGSHIYCPKCGAEVCCMDRARLKWGNAVDDVCASLVFNRVGDLIVAVGYRLTRLVTKDGENKKIIEPYDAYVFGLEKPLHFSMWESWNMNKYPTEKFVYKSTFTDSWMCSRNVIYPFEESLLSGTCLENSKVVQYLNNTHDSRLMKYCQQYLLYPGIENLLTQGFKHLIKEKLSGGQDINHAISWRETSPLKMLGLNRPEMKTAKKERWSASQLLRYKWQRNRGITLSREENNQLENVGLVNLEEMEHKYQIDSAKLFRYLQRQTKKQRDAKNTAGNISYFFKEWKDYMEMGKDLGYDLAQENVFFPPHLMKAHERATDAREFKVNEAKRKLFDDVYRALEPLAWKHKNLIIRPARDEQELINEGKALSHCVGGYGRAHSEDGKPIFFIRKADAPDIPFFTLQLGTKSKQILNNLGYKNNNPSIGGKPRPKYVDDFAKLWLETMVKPYDFKTRKFKKSRKTNKKPAA